MKILWWLLCDKSFLFQLNFVAFSSEEFEVTYGEKYKLGIFERTTTFPLRRYFFLESSSTFKNLLISKAPIVCQSSYNTAKWQFHTIERYVNSPYFRINSKMFEIQNNSKITEIHQDWKCHLNICFLLWISILLFLNLIRKNSRKIIWNWKMHVIYIKTGKSTSWSMYSVKKKLHSHELF